MRSGPIWQVEFAFEQLIAPGIWLFGGLILGWLLYKLTNGRLRRAVTLTSWGGDDLVLHALHHVLLVWLTLAGAYGALRAMPLRADIDRLAGRVLLSIAVISGTWVIARFIADLVKLFVLRTGGVRSSATLMINLARILVFILGFLVLLQTLGISIGPVLGALGVGGIALALALQDTLASIVAGVQLLASKKIQPGDYIEISGSRTGTVTDIDWRNTTIRTMGNNDVIVPNSVLAQEVIVNYARPVQEMSLPVEVGVSYDSDLEQVERVCIDVAREVLRSVEGAVETFDPLVRYHTFSESSIDFKVILRTTQYENRILLQHEFVKALKARFDAEGIVIPFPIRTVHMAPADGG